MDETLFSGYYLPHDLRRLARTSNPQQIDQWMHPHRVSECGGDLPPSGLEANAGVTRLRTSRLRSTGGWLRRKTIQILVIKSQQRKARCVVEARSGSGFPLREAVG
jgi:hypothetical protein